MDQLAVRLIRKSNWIFMAKNQGNFDPLCHRNAMHDHYLETLLSSVGEK